MHDEQAPQRGEDVERVLRAGDLCVGDRRPRRRAQHVDELARFLDPEQRVVGAVNDEERRRVGPDTRDRAGVVPQCRVLLARDLHDSVKQQVFATAMQVGAARELLPDNPIHAENRLVDAEQLTRQAQQELNTLICELRPVVLENKGLAKALREYLGDWSNQTGMQVDLRLQGERILPLDIEQTLYRVTQEALATITRHSGATSVEVHLNWENSRVTLNIVDNGHGFDLPAAEGKGVGLQSMRERVQESGGIFTVESNANGTRIEAVIPIQKAG